MFLNICNFIQRTEQVPIKLDISAIEDYILLLLLNVIHFSPKFGDKLLLYDLQCWDIITLNHTLDAICLIMFETYAYICLHRCTLDATLRCLRYKNNNAEGQIICV